MLAGMGAVAAAIIGAPLTMVFLVLEATGDFQVTIAVVIAVTVASTIVRILFGYSFATWRFHLRGLSIRGAHDVGWIRDMTVGRLMRSDAKTVPENMTLAAVREAYPLGDAKKVFVVSASGAYKGTLDLTAIHDGKHDKELDLTAGKLAKSPHLVLRPLQNVKTALNLFEVHQTEMLPVVETGEHGQIIGYMTEQYALRRYNQELERRRSADLGEKDLFSIVEPPIKGP